MKNRQEWRWAVTLGTAVALCGTLAAQSPTTPDPQAPGATPGSSSATGCLQRAAGSSSSDTSASSPSSASSSSASGGSFVLKNVKFGGASGSPSSTSSAPSGEAAPPSSAPPSSTPPAGGAPSGTMAGAGGRAPGGVKELKLMADSAVNLAEHVGHQVMVTGRFSGGSGASSPSSAPSPSASSPSSASDMSGRGGTFTVTSISMISATCPAGS